MNTDSVYGTIAQATAETPAAQEITKKRRTRKTYTEQETAEILQTLNTAGKKGVKLPRINLAFTQTNYDYISTMSRAAGLNLTEFVNKIIDGHREDHAKLYEQAIEFRNSL